ncbi:N-acylneuraminate cytidylyltransferase [Armadillidium vulgare]|nr:N-acylneuraminate cytidylyltransferase [Armadillidium vulgare]
MKVCGLILARKNSKGIVNKNLSLLDGVPLIAATIRVMKKSNCFCSIFVSTDCDKIESLAKEEEALVHRRADYTATDEASSVLAVQEFLQYHNNICLVQCTSPFLRESYLKEGFALFTNNSEWDSVFSVTRRRILRWSEDVALLKVSAEDSFDIDSPLDSIFGPTIN